MRFVDDGERLALVLGHIKFASESIESVRIALAEDFLASPDAAVAILDAALDRLMIAYDDLTGD